MNTDTLNSAARLAHEWGVSYREVSRAASRASAAPKVTLNGVEYFDNGTADRIRAELRTVERAVAVDPIPRNRTPGHPGMETR